VFILEQEKHLFYKFTFPRKNFNFLIDIKINHSWFQKNRTNNSFGYLKCSNPNKTPSNADANFESTRLKLDFSQTLSLRPNLNNDVFKGKVFEQKRDTTTNWKVIKKILIRKQNYA